MKPDIHPAYKEINVVCSCGSTFITGSTLDHDLHIEICSKCHPFYTGTQKLIDTAGRVDRFRQKYGQGNKTAPTKTDKPEAVKAAPVKAEATKTEKKPVEKKPRKSVDKKQKDE